MGFKSIDYPSRSSEFEHNPKTSISILWLERGGRWGLSPSTSLPDHQKLNIIQKQAFHFVGWRGVVDRVWVHRLAWPSIDQPNRSSEVECNAKMSISFCWLERGGRWGSSPSTSPESEHNQIMSISIFGWRGVVDGVWVYWPTQLIIRH